MGFPEAYSHVSRFGLLTVLEDGFASSGGRRLNLIVDKAIVMLRAAETGKPYRVELRTAHPNIPYQVFVPSVGPGYTNEFSPNFMTAVPPPFEMEDAYEKSRDLGELSHRVGSRMFSRMTMSWIRMGADGAWGTMGPLTSKGCKAALDGFPTVEGDHVRLAVSISSASLMPDPPRTGSWKRPTRLADGSSSVAAACSGNGNGEFDIHVAVVTAGKDVDAFAASIIEGGVK